MDEHGAEGAVGQEQLGVPADCHMGYEPIPCGTRWLGQPRDFGEGKRHQGAVRNVIPQVSFGPFVCTVVVLTVAAHVFLAGQLPNTVKILRVYRAYTVRNNSVNDARQIRPVSGINEVFSDKLVQLGYTWDRRLLRIIMQYWRGAWGGYFQRISICFYSTRDACTLRLPRYYKFLCLLGEVYGKCWQMFCH